MASCVHVADMMSGLIGGQEGDWRGVVGDKCVVLGWCDGQRYRVVGSSAGRSCVCVCVLTVACLRVLIVACAGSRCWLDDY
jgi:hypothetical protein